ncbi:hypothetical protein XH83_09625 [Bradyrhizobium sp. CCBAU 53351]|uniref:hypothetical protein n=1 Tax=Bradyrhizobium sp. CCBAU 53351 TaxID=1325114 RepID=UPI0018897F70|nr:hypothetical protein [Bradyrhizobium sp. CCBAU 53351]QOZ75679.1 hypothetical protein XH83_09625 [Bradyrhizobium sp. CCBAU 53351]
MSSLAPSSVVVALLAVLCPIAAPVQAQVAPLRYWVPGGPFGLSGGANQSSDRYGNFTSLNAGDADSRSGAANGFFVGSQRGNLNWSALGQIGLSQAGFAGNFNALSYDSTQFGYSTKTAGGLPVTFFAGFDTLKYGNGIGSSIAPLTSGAAPGYSAFAGVEFKPTSNLSLSFGAGFIQQDSGRMDSDIRSNMLPGESPALSGLRR